MEEQMRLILNKEELSRISFNENEMTVDVHGLSVNKMIHFLKNISCIYRFDFKLRIIHGYTHGTKIKDTIATTKIFTRNYSLEPDEFNPGVTTVVFA